MIQFRNTTNFPPLLSKLWRGELHFVIIQRTIPLMVTKFTHLKFEDITKSLIEFFMRLLLISTLFIEVPPESS